MNTMQNKINILYGIPIELQKHPGKLLEAQVQILQEIVDARQKSKLASILPLLDRDSELTPRVLETVLSLLELFDTTDFLNLDLHVRQSNYASSWRQFEPYSMPQAGRNQYVDGNAILFAIYSMHPNGFVREKALKALGTFVAPRVLPFVLLRLNDCVAPIRVLAEGYLEGYLNDDLGLSLMECLPIVEHIKKWYRGQRRDLLDRIDQVMEAKLSPCALAPLMSKSSRILRRSLIHLIPSDPAYDRLSR